MRSLRSEKNEGKSEREQRSESKVTFGSERIECCACQDGEGRSLRPDRPSAELQVRVEDASSPFLEHLFPAKNIL